MFGMKLNFGAFFYAYVNVGSVRVVRMKILHYTRTI